MFIDADAHVDECTDTWSYFPKAKADIRPGEMVFLEGEEPEYLRKKLRGPARGLFIDGRIYQRRVRDDELAHTTVGIRELQDVAARVRHMDEIGVGVQVLYPSTLLEEVTRRPEVEIPICESYNRWIADRSADSNGRLRWTAPLPLRSMPDALAEMRRVKDAGAVGVFKRAFECDERPLGDEYFYPMYEVAQELDLPVCVHVSSPYSGTTPFTTKTEPRIRHAFYIQDAVLSLLLQGVYKKFPRLRFGFVEAASTWLPYVLMVARSQTLSPDALANLAREGKSKIEHEELLHPYDTILEESRIFVACEAIEDLPSIISVAGDNNLCVGTDYGHSDRTSVLNAHQLVLDRGDLSDKTGEKLTETNARTLYGLY